MRLTIDGKSYLAHRLAWLYMTGKHPQWELDHIDRNGRNNAWSNLRLATRKEQMWNLNPRSKSGYTGVYAHGKRWRAEITNNYVKIRIGSFPTKEEAIVAYEKAAKLRTYKPKEKF